MNPALLDILPHVRQGYCCSQLLMVLALQAKGQDAPELVRALNGLCHGLGFSGGPCGLLTGGAAVLGLLAGKDAMQEALPCLNPVINDYANWFYERTAPYGGCSCEQVASGLQGGQATSSTTAAGDNAPDPPDPMLCGVLLVECWDQLRLLARDYALDLNA